MTRQPHMTPTCEYLFCDQPSVARVTVPHLKPRQCNCEQHLADTLKWAAQYRDVLGAVIVERAQP